MGHQFALCCHGFCKCPNHLAFNIHLMLIKIWVSCLVAILYSHWSELFWFCILFCAIYGSIKVSPNFALERCVFDRHELICTVSWLFYVLLAMGICNPSDSCPVGKALLQDQLMPGLFTPLSLMISMVWKFFFGKFMPSLLLAFQSLLIFRSNNWCSHMGCWLRLEK